MSSWLLYVEKKIIAVGEGIQNPLEKLLLGLSKR
jgi:hypothetical protein